MIGYVILLLACGNVVFSESRDFVEAYKKFNYAKRYIDTRLGPLLPQPDINDDEDRRHLSFGTLVAVTAAITKARSPWGRSNATALEITSEKIPYTWSHYNDVSRQTLGYFKKLIDYTKPVTDLIDGCREVPFQCNDLIEKKVKSDMYKYQKPADVLISIGESTQVFRNNLELVEYITRRSREIPYLLNNVNSYRYQQIIKQLYDTYLVIQRHLA